ncbi:MAG: helix-turn-helix domain-containing protein [Clostridia bacterium]|nr:helix-turn-helix domain-containing protein [Clostridia bacterium]
MIKINEQISQLRRQAGMTQEELAVKLGVTNQAVSKWESAQCCPDIALLPDIARLFGLTVDELLTGAPAEKPVGGDLPDVLKNDGVIRVLQFKGRELIRWDKREENGEKNTIKLEFPESGDKAHIEIYGNVESEGNVNCGNVGGDVQACGGVNCGNVGSDVQAGGDLNCGNVGDYVEADGDVACGNVDGNVNAGEDVTVDTVYGDVSAGGDVKAGTVNGDVSAGGDVRCETLNGDRD